ncbi:sugar phosphate isomerase/epimerase family protein [Paenibacillus endoradicis]|uniref:sugar phosphate isomerase/epimerase family protein n=1 Tax=Paenibacillus endoradicis TaxID=2972487 RepID=UPI0021598E88|nr:sugar phosphate isomerase/epimerase family protein [Paenibacillus endoradicis]MCR8657837.1 sugar phosphate isomerase/epimerase [Paenibacillus endoradicis]
MKFSVFTVMMPDCNIEQTVQLLSDNQYDGVEWRFIDPDLTKSSEAPSFWGNNYSTVPASSTIEQLQYVSNLSKGFGLSQPNLASYITCGDLIATERAMKAAQQLGAPSIRIGVPSYDGTISYQQCLADGRAYLDQVQQLAQQYKVKGAIETHHGNIACSASAALRLVEGFDPSCIGIIYDPGNMVHEGYEHYQMGLEMIGDYLTHVHVKNASYALLTSDDSEAAIWQVHWSAIDKGAVQWHRVIKALRAIGYDGWLSMEDFSSSQSTESLLQHNISYIKSLL